MSFFSSAWCGFPIVESVFVPTDLEIRKYLLMRRLETEDQESDPGRNLERSERRPDLVRVISETMSSFSDDY